MSSPFVGEIRAVGFDFAPSGWATCDGQLLPISQNTALFSLLGTYYGGDGKSTFALPNLQGSTPIGTGDLWGRERALGEQGGSPWVTLIQSEMPVHSHALRVSTEAGDLQAPGADRALGRSSPGQAYSASAGNVTLGPQAMSIAGGSMPHNNMAPALVVTYIIALQGVFPQRP
jgi:microcystin-dependent protein